MATFRHVTYSSFLYPREPVTVSVCLKTRERMLKMRGGNRAGEDHLGVWGVVHVTDGKKSHEANHPLSHHHLLKSTLIQRLYELTKPIL